MTLVGWLKTATERELCKIGQLLTRNCCQRFVKSNTVCQIQVGVYESRGTLLYGVWCHFTRYVLPGCARGILGVTRCILLLGVYCSLFAKYFTLCIMCVIMCIVMCIVMCVMCMAHLTQITCACTSRSKILIEMLIYNPHKCYG